MNDLRPSTVTVARATRHDAFAVAALHLQRDRAAGVTLTPGFLDRCADWWLRYEREHVTWLATASGGDPVGAVTGVVVDEGPRADGVDVAWLHLTFAYVASTWRDGDVGVRLVAQAQDWATRRGLTGLRMGKVDGLDGAAQVCGLTPDAGAQHWAAGLEVRRG